MRATAVLLAALALGACEPIERPAQIGDVEVRAELPAADADAATADAETPVAADVSPASATVRVK
jgi:ActR/RegA family two-component response regulator